MRERRFMMDMILRANQAQRDYLYNKVLRLADALGCFFTYIEEMKSVLSIKEYEVIIEEMEKELAHKRDMDEAIANWYRDLDRRGGYSGD